MSSPLPATPQLRKITLFIPPPQSPLLTTYSRSLLPRLGPLKQKYSIKPVRLQSPSKQVHEHDILLMEASEIDIINGLYRKIKRSRGEGFQDKESMYVRDPLYKAIYRMKLEGGRLSRSKRERDGSEGENGEGRERFRRGLRRSGSVME